jgi:hypothetical protein
LEPLQNFIFEKYHPSNGHLSVASDREKIIQLINDLEPYMNRVEVGYVGKGRMVISMERVYLHMPMEECMKENGRMTTYTERGK